MTAASDALDRYGPVALVTGASSGIGRSFAEILAARGFDLVLVARRVDRLAETAARLAAAHAIDVAVLGEDLAVPAAPARILDATRDRDIGLIVSNAGFGLKGAHEDNDPAKLAEMLTVNCHAPLQLAHGFIPRLRARGQGGILLTSSVEGLIGCPYSTAYAATKALVIALGEGLWGELSPAGIDVLTLCPGPTDTEAAALQGMDLSANPNTMSADAVATLALDHIADGPTLVASDVYRAMFAGLTAMPRREALTAMANGLRPKR